MPPEYELVPVSPDRVAAVGTFDTRFWRNARVGNPLAIYLTLHALDRVVRELLPFYGGDCPISVVYGRNWANGQVVQGTLATIEDGTRGAPNDRSTLVLVG